MACTDRRRMPRIFLLLYVSTDDDNDFRGNEDFSENETSQVHTAVSRMVSREDIASLCVQYANNKTE